MPGMSRGGGMMPGFGGGGMGSRGGGGMPGQSADMVGGIVGNMFGGMPMAPGMRGGGINPGNNYGAGQPPSLYTGAYMNAKSNCLAGDGRACHTLQLLEAQHQRAMENWQYQQQQGQYGYQQRNRPMGQRSGRGW